MPTDKILVLGASGYVGSRLIPVLLDRGYAVRAAARSLEGLRRRPWAGHPNIELVEADVLDLESLNRAVQDCRAVYYFVHSMNLRHPDFVQADRTAARNMVRAMTSSRIERLIYLGGLGDEKNHLSRHLRSRAEVGAILQTGGTPATVLRAAMIIGTGSAPFEILRYLVHHFPVAVTPRGIYTESQPIAIRNVLYYLAGCLESHQTLGQVYDIGGPEVISYYRLMEIFAQEARLPRRVIFSVPFFPVPFISYWVGKITPVPHYLARPLAEGMLNRVVCRDNRIQETIPQELLDCRQAVRLSLDSRPYTSGNETPGSHHIPPCEWQYPGDPSWVGGKA